MSVFLDSAYVGRSRSPHARRSHSKADPLWTAFIRQTPTMRTSQAIQGYCQGQFEEVTHTPTVTHQCPTRSRTVAFDVSDSHHRFWGSTGWQSTEETGSPQAPGRQQHQHGMAVWSVQQCLLIQNWAHCPSSYPSMKQSIILDGAVHVCVDS